MKIDELRIGNIVDYETIPYVIHYLYSSGQVGLIAIKHNWGLETCFISELQPIELTKDILLDNGFERNDSGMYYYKDDKSIAYRLEGNLLYNDVHIISFKVKYLHQLQNIISDIKNGKEIHTQENG